MLGRRHQKYQKVDVDAVQKDLFAAGCDTPPRRPFAFTSACLWRSFFTIVLICIYFAPSIGLTFYQRWLYKSFKSPLFTVTIHMIVKLLLAVIIKSLIALKFPKQRLSLGLTWKEYIIAIAPAGVFSGIDIGFSNWGLELITISLYTMAKSSTIIFILGFAILFKLEKLSCSLASIVAMIAFGLFLVTYKASEFNLLGFVLVLLAAMSSGIRWTCVQMLMQKSKLGMKSPIDMIYHMQSFMIISVLPFMVTIEGSRVVDEFTKLSGEDPNEMWWLIAKILLGAFIAFFMEFSEVMVVSYTSSLTLSIAGIFKELFMLFLAYLTGDKFSTINVIGLVFCIGGIVIHVVHKISAIQAQTMRAYEFDASDSYDFGVSKSLLEAGADIEQMHLTSESEEEEQDSQEIFNILNRHDRSLIEAYNEDPVAARWGKPYAARPYANEAFDHHQNDPYDSYEMSAHQHYRPEMHAKPIEPPRVPVQPAQYMAPHKVVKPPPPMPPPKPMKPQGKKGPPIPFPDYPQPPSPKNLRSVIKPHSSYM